MSVTNRLVFDVTDSDTIAASSSVGAFVRSSDGTLIDHTTISLSEYLNAAAALFDGSGTALTSTLINSDQSLDVFSYLRDDNGTAITGTTVGSDHGLDVNVINSIDVDDGLANTAIENTKKDVSTTGALLASQLASRKYLFLQLLGNKPIFIGKSGVDETNGFKMYPDQVFEFRLGPAVSMHAKASTGTQETRIMEFS